MQQCLTHSVALVRGGVRSGKSRYVQQIGERSGRVKFIATAERREDSEMLAKLSVIARNGQVTGLRVLSSSFRRSW